MPDTPLSLFISYSHADSAFVDQLEADLRKLGFETWVDRQRLAGGQRWRRELQEAVEHAQVLLIVLSPDAIASQSVQIEFDYALDLGKVLIPVYYRQCTVPMELRAIQWIDFRHSYEEGLTALLNALHRQQQRVAPAASSDQTSPGNLGDQQHQPAQNGQAKVGQVPFNNLPAQLTPLIGRAHEIASASALLRQAEVRLITLTGTGGIGKTRLGLQIATDLLRDFADGVYFVSLAPLSDPALVLAAIALTFSLREVGDQTVIEQLKAYLREKHLLLVLDNFEQVVAAAPLLLELLEAFSHLKLLVTSRAVLNVRGEHIFPVPPLTVPNLAQLPDLEDLSRSAAVALFLERASAVKPQFELTQANAASIAELCVRLEGLPLAIELAAARIKVFAPQALLARLSQRLQLLSGGARDLPARQQTLYNTIKWSYDLLEQEAQTVFRLFSVFEGGCTLEAAEAVCQGAGKASLNVVNALSTLLDNSLLQQSDQQAVEPRFQMLQTEREYGLETLAARGELSASQAAHARYFLALAEQAQPQLHGPKQTAWLERLEQEHDNLRTALEWALEDVTGEQAKERRECALRLSAALWEFWWMHGHFSEGRTFLERALAQSEGENSPLRASVLRAAANLAEWQGDDARAEGLFQQSLALYRELGDTRGIANSLFLFAGTAWRRGQIAEGIAFLEERVRLMREVGEPWEVADALVYLATLVSFHGEYPRGQTLFEEALVLSRKAGNKLMVGVTLLQSAFCLWLAASGDAATIHQRLQEGQALFNKVGDPNWKAQYSLEAARVALSEGETTRAYDLAQESLALYRAMDSRWYMARTLSVLGGVETQRGDLRAARSRYQESLALSRELGEKYIIPFSLEGLASVLSTQGELKWAAQLWGAAEALREAIAAPLPPVDRLLYERAVATARAQLGEQAFAAAWQDGQTMKPEQVIDDVLKRGDEIGKQ